jgi:hypothetical protein
MRLVPVPTGEELGEDGWIIAAAETVINPDYVETRSNNVTAEKAWESSWAETEPFKASKIL